MIAAGTGGRFDTTRRGRGNPLFSFGGQIVSDVYTRQMPNILEELLREQSVELAGKVIDGKYGKEVETTHKRL
jgi:hypothetical protein